jgi:hypothetical protein
MCHLKIIKCRWCSSTREVHEACAQQQLYDPECEAHEITQADDQHPELWVEHCRHCTPSRPVVSGPPANAVPATSDQDTRLHQTIFMAWPSWVENYGNPQAGLLEPPDLYDPDLDKEEMYSNVGEQWTEAETRVLERQWPDRSVPFQVKSLVIRGVNGTL